MLATVTAELWPFFRVTVLAALVVPSAWLPKDRLVGDAVTLWASAAKLLNSSEHASANAEHEVLTSMFDYAQSDG